ncbi:hypothetical protein FA15DRAFT_261013 [Coprinopsis marcescibilis]|uniref:Uncharacterized protein n=1 Tax=Coprinopsis marcescibilis TaxID=230819 RepID=A0A5C3KF68_COPMA|nr:hypothetical protein FA15DRAFT_261013 [Coprinopsis marcescibilis]
MDHRALLLKVLHRAARSKYVRRAGGGRQVLGSVPRVGRPRSDRPDPRAHSRVEPTNWPASSKYRPPIHSLPNPSALRGSVPAPRQRAFRVRRTDAGRHVRSEQTPRAGRDAVSDRVGAQARCRAERQRAVEVLELPSGSNIDDAYASSSYERDSSPHLGPVLCHHDF